MEQTQLELDFKIKLIKIGAIIILLVILITGTVGTIEAGERGVKVRLGNVVGTLDSGLYFKIPFIERVKKINVQTQAVLYEREEPLTSASKPRF